MNDPSPPRTAPGDTPDLPCADRRRVARARAALRELAGADPAARRALSRGLAEGARRGLDGAALLVAGLLAMERGRGPKPA